MKRFGMFERIRSQCQGHPKYCPLVYVFLTHHDLKGKIFFLNSILLFELKFRSYSIEYFPSNYNFNRWCSRWKHWFAQKCTSFFQRCAEVHEYSPFRDCRQRQYYAPNPCQFVYTWIPLFSVFITNQGGLGAPLDPRHVLPILLINQGGLGAPLDPRPWTFNN